MPQLLVWCHCRFRFLPNYGALLVSKLSLHHTLHTSPSYTLLSLHHLHTLYCKLSLHHLHTLYCKLSLHHLHTLYCKSIEVVYPDSQSSKLQPESRQALLFLRSLIESFSYSIVSSPVSIGKVLYTFWIGTSSITGAWPSRFWKCFFHSSTLASALLTFICPVLLFIHPETSSIVAHTSLDFWFSYAFCSYLILSST